jgi:hypothetical protein
MIEPIQIKQRPYPEAAISVFDNRRYVGSFSNVVRFFLLVQRYESRCLGIEIKKSTTSTPRPNLFFMILIECKYFIVTKTMGYEPVILNVPCF